MIRLFRFPVPTQVLVLLLCDAALIAACYLLPGLLGYLDMDVFLFLFYDGGLAQLTVLVLSTLLVMYFQDLYTQLYVPSRVQLTQQFLVVVGVVFLIQATLGYASRSWAIPHRMMLAGSALVLPALIGWRMVYSAINPAKLGSAKNVLFLGADSMAQEIAAYLHQRPGKGYRTSGYLDNQLPEGTILPGGKVLGGLPALPAVAARTKPDLIVLGMEDWRDELPLQELLELRLAGVAVESTTPLFEALCGRFCVRGLRPSQVIFDHELEARRSSLALQALYTDPAGLLGLVLLSPLLLLVALAVQLSAAGPVLERHERVGFNGIPFTMLRFRCTAGSPPRETRLGHWLRRTHLDALPLVFNIMRGELALVGPQAERPELVDALAGIIPYYRQRYRVKPGITGWYQTHRSHDALPADAVTQLEYDLYYIKNASLSLDAYIILRALKRLLVP